MSKKEKKELDSRKIFYIVTAVSMLIFAVGVIITAKSGRLDGSVFNKRLDFLADMTFFIPFCLWAWIVVFGLLFVRKNFLVITICILLAIPHIIFIAVMIGYSNSAVEILKRYVMIFSFGSLML
ncbi:hypothetical protein [Lagierella massiliensis]|uniref:hypothetical protein n=1 Tax=Lagierella massiliensis TaxID=1689303 RepID=UPI0006D83C11|nr:hypothetical protein [Lagierella massiliensis]